MKTVLLCGGFGTRLSEETVVKPKPMVQIGSHPILWHIMNIYSHFGHNEFLLALGYQGRVIKDYFLNYYALDSDFTIDLSSGKINYLKNTAKAWKVDLIETGANTMTGGRLLRLKPHLVGNGTFMVTYGDGVANVDVDQLIRFHRTHGKIATLTAVRPPARFGALQLSDKDQVTQFKEKPQLDQGWINGGYFVFEESVFDYIQDDNTVLEESPLERLAQEGELMAYRHNGFWQCMDTLRDKNALEALWLKDKAPWKMWRERCSKTSMPESVF